MSNPDAPAIGKDWITTNEAAELTGYTPHYIRMLAREAALPAVKAGRDWLVSREAALAWREKMDALGSEKHNPWRDDLAQQGRGRIE